MFTIFRYLAQNSKKGAHLEVKEVLNPSNDISEMSIVHETLRKTLEYTKASNINQHTYYLGIDTVSNGT